MSYPLSSYAQGFEENSIDAWLLHQYNQGDYGGGISFVDFNNDGLDDISFCQKDGPSEFFVNMGDHFEELTIPEIPTQDEQKMLTWVDFDNDGDLDLFITSSFSPWRLFRNQGNFEFLDISVQAGFPETEYKTFGHSWGDYNNDGFLDVYICNYNDDGVTNFLFSNNGDATFTDVTELAGVGNGSTYTFQSLWIDYDKDGLQDLFVINDRLSENAHNYMYHNEGDSTFTDVSFSSDLAYVIFSMSATGGDYDNDGDLDLYVSNNPFGHLLHRNEGNGTFSEVAESAGVVTYDMGWAGQWVDYDLDGHQDLHICTSPFWIFEGQIGQDKFYTNNGDGTFDLDVGVGFADDETWNHSSAVGDWNNDGHFDIVTECIPPDFSRLYTSIQSGRNHLKVSLEGTFSNKDGIGSFIDVYSELGHQTRYTYCGEGYLSQNSKNEIFGLGYNEIVDSVVVTWLSGIVDQFYNLEVNEHYHFVEGTGQGSSQNINVYLYTEDDQMSFCEGDSIMVFSDEFESYLWSTGDTTSYTYIDVEGEVSLEVMVGDNTYLSDPIYLEVYAPMELEWSITNAQCFGSNNGALNLIQIAGPDMEIVYLNAIEQSLPIDSLFAGDYQVLVIDTNECKISFPVTINEPDSMFNSVNSVDISCFGFEDGSASIEVYGGTPEYVVDWGSLDSNALGVGVYEIPIQDSQGCSDTAIVDIWEPAELVLTVNIDLDNMTATAIPEGGVEPYSIQWSTGNDTEWTIDLIDYDSYTAWLIDANGCEDEETFMFTGKTELLNEGFHIYPNPFDASIQLEAPDNGLYKIELFDITGKIIIAMGGVMRTERLHTSDLAAGVYFLAIDDESGKRIQTLRLVKK